jgi:hypothetical protein
MLEFGNRRLDRIVTPAANHDRRAAGRQSPSRCSADAE